MFGLLITIIIGFVVGVIAEAHHARQGEYGIYSDDFAGDCRFDCRDLSRSGRGLV